MAASETGICRHEINILYEDNHLLVVEKPPNILSQADDTGDPDLLSLLKAGVKQRYNKPGEVYLGLVHRLDRPVGGVMVFARTSKAASRLSDQIRQGTFRKTYLAVVHGVPDKPAAMLEHYLCKDAATNTVSVVSAKHPGAKKALLDYEVLDRAEGMSLVRIHLHTGRSHQIRVQMAAIGHPLAGDQKYGVQKGETGLQIALWSSSITCTHPTTRQEMTFHSAYPDCFPWSAFSPSLGSNKR